MTIVKVLWAIGSILLFWLGIGSGTFKEVFFGIFLPYSFVMFCYMGAMKPFDDYEKRLDDFRKKNPNLFKDDD